MTGGRLTNGPRGLAKATGDDFYRKLGEGLAGTLECLKCRQRVTIDEFQAGRFVRAGWPICCNGQEMDLTPNPEPGH